MENIVTLNKVGYRRQNRWLLEDINLQVDQGKFVAIVGPNGAGKSTLLRLISGEFSPTLGEVKLFGKPVSQYPTELLARERAVLTQQRHLNFPFQTREVVLLGRYAYLNQNHASVHDWRHVEQSMKLMKVNSLQHRIYQSLSGGEATRVDMARILAQTPKLFLLDEPTNHLDPQHQVEVLNVCQHLVAEGRTVVAALHDLNVAAHYSDHVVILSEGKLVFQGSPEETFTPERLQRVYGIPFEVWPHPKRRLVVMPEFINRSHVSTNRPALNPTPTQQPAASLDPTSVASAT